MKADTPNAREVGTPLHPVARPRHRMEIEWSAADEAYVVAVPDLPGCMTHGATYEEAARMGAEAIALWLDGARRRGTTIPEPRAVRHPLAPTGD